MFTVLKIFEVPKIYKNYKNIFFVLQITEKRTNFFYIADFTEECKAVLNFNGILNVVFFYKNFL